MAMVDSASQSNNGPEKLVNVTMGDANLQASGLGPFVG